MVFINMAAAAELQINIIIKAAIRIDISLYYSVHFYLPPFLKK